jgi:hypothetical protein
MARASVERQVFENRVVKIASWSEGTKKGAKN